MHEQIKVNLNNLVLEAILYGGASVQIFTGHTPKDGFMVSRYPTSELVVQKLTPLILGRFIHDNMAALRCSRNYVGIWVNKHDIYLDVSTYFNNLAMAIVAGRTYNQLAIYDVVNQKDIDIYNQL